MAGKDLRQPPFLLPTLFSLIPHMATDCRRYGPHPSALRAATFPKGEGYLRQLPFLIPNPYSLIPNPFSPTVV